MASEQEEGGYRATKQKAQGIDGRGSMSRSREDWRREGERGDHEKTLPFVGGMSGQVLLYMEREKGGGRVPDRQRHRNPISSTRNSKIIGGYAVSYQDTPPHPSPLPSITIYTGSAGKTLKRWDVGQEVRGSKASARSQSEK